MAERATCTDETARGRPSGRPRTIPQTPAYSSLTVIGPFAVDSFTVSAPLRLGVPGVAAVVVGVGVLDVEALAAAGVGGGGLQARLQARRWG